MATVSASLINGLRGVPAVSTERSAAPEQPPWLQSPQTGMYIRPEHEIMGIASVDAEDRNNIEHLMQYALTIKCTDKNYSSDGYDRASWWRVERGSGDYLLLLGGWQSLEFMQQQLIWNYDTHSGDARNIAAMEILLR